MNAIQRDVQRETETQKLISTDKRLLPSKLKEYVVRRVRERKKEKRVRLTLCHNY